MKSLLGIGRIRQISPPSRILLRFFHSINYFQIVIRQCCLYTAKWRSQESCRKEYVILGRKFLILDLNFGK